MYHSITFSTAPAAFYTAEEADSLGRSDLAGMLKGYNTWYDWHLIPSSRPTIEHPQITTTFVKIPGRNGSIDITNFVSNSPTMADRTGSFEFIAVESSEGFNSMRFKLVMALHGQKMLMSFEDDPGYYYVGRFSIKTWKNEKTGPYVNIDYQVEPYKYNQNGTKVVDGDL